MFHANLYWLLLWRMDGRMEVYLQEVRHFAEATIQKPVESMHIG